MNAAAELEGLNASARRNAGYLAREEIERILAPLRADPRRLEPHGFKVYSQSDEDGILEEIFRRLGVGPGRFVEIGVENGLECNTLYLLHKGWTGVWIEGDPAQQGPIQERFASLVDRRLFLAFGTVTAENIGPVLRQLEQPHDVDLFSIDIDGNDIHVLAALELRPKVVVIEYNAKFRPDLSKQPVYDPRRFWRGGDFAGSSLKAICEVAGRMGYRLVATNLTGANAFFVREDLAGGLFADPATPEALYHPPRYWLWLDHYRHVGLPADFGRYADLEPAQQGAKAE
ncbi:hypothetical protein [Phenylobacterium sp.]|uniref:hypothetical protein n=1 Tax=Phenylobacterium sp. TaxID=1871053 RepID=UPI0025DBDDF4|nr:hypothetical protein [Phenylobacterium sp.]